LATGSGDWQARVCKLVIIVLLDLSDLSCYRELQPDIIRRGIVTSMLAHWTRSLHAFSCLSGSKVIPFSMYLLIPDAVTLSKRFRQPS